jgi:hypothetical protein
VLIAAGAVLAGAALAQGTQPTVQMPQHFPITPNEPKGSWTLKRAVTVTFTCQPSGSATSCPATFRLFADGLTATKTSSLPTIPYRVQLSVIMNTYSPGNHTVKLHFKLTHQVLNLLYAYTDPRCYAQALIVSGGAPSSPAQTQVLSPPSPSSYASIR